MKQDGATPSPSAAPARKGSLLRTVRAVAWSFLGVRKGAEYRQDLEKIQPLHIIVIGLVAAFLFVALLMVAVNWVVHA